MMQLYLCRVEFVDKDTYIYIIHAYNFFSSMGSHQIKLNSNYD